MTTSTKTTKTTVERCDEDGRVSAVPHRPPGTHTSLAALREKANRAARKHGLKVIEVEKALEAYRAAHAEVLAYAAELAKREAERFRGMSDYELQVAAAFE